MGYHMAGFDVTGVDIENQPRYPFRFWRQDVMTITDKQINNIRKNFDAVGASPPCQEYSVTKKRFGGKSYPKLIEPTRELLESIELPYIIENVPGAPLISPVQLCGSAFGLRVRRHRIFESNTELYGIKCDHDWQLRHRPYRKIQFGAASETTTGTISVFGRGDGSFIGDLRQVDIWRVAMGIDWMITDELSEAIPPVYTFYLGQQLRNFL